MDSQELITKMMREFEKDNPVPYHTIRLRDRYGASNSCTRDHDYKLHKEYVAKFKEWLDSLNFVSAKSVPEEAPYGYVWEIKHEDSGTVVNSGFSKDWEGALRKPDKVQGFFIEALPVFTATHQSPQVETRVRELVSVLNLTLAYIRPLVTDSEKLSIKEARTLVGKIDQAIKAMDKEPNTLKGKTR